MEVGVQVSKDVVTSSPSESVVSEEAQMVDLTRRQSEVLHLLAKGYSNQEISQLLGISGSTTKIHVRAILKVLGKNTRTEAAVFVRSGKFQELISETEKVNNINEVCHPSVPGLAEGALYFLLSCKDRDTILGDLREEYSQLVKRFGLRFARSWYWKETLSAILTRNFLMRWLLIAGLVKWATGWLLGR